MSTKTFVGFTPHKKQREIIQSILTSSEKFHIACIGRQFGKSMLGMNLALYWMINNGPCKVLWVSPVYSQSNKVHEELYAAIADSGIVASNNFSSNKITLKNGSTMIFRSAERYDNIRGETCDYGILDEAAFMKDDAWAEAIRPVFAVKGKKVLFISTPKSKNWFYNLYQLGESSDHPNYKSYKGSSYDTPYISHSEVDEAKQTLPPNIFRQEYLAEFLDSGGEVFSDLDSISSPVWPKATGKIYCGLDVARAEDYSVATFQDASGNVVDIYRANNKDWSTIVDEVVQRIRKWNATTMVEVNGVGDPIFEMIKKQWHDTHPFITSSKSKNEIIEGLILDVNQKSIRIPGKEVFPPLTHEMEIFTYSYNPKTRSVRYSHPPGQHDDTVLSLSICNFNRKSNKTLGTYSYRRN